MGQFQTNLAQLKHPWETGSLGFFCKKKKKKEKEKGDLNQQFVKINSHEKQNCASIMRLTLKYNDVVKHYGTQRTLRRRTIPMYFVFDANN